MRILNNVRRKVVALATVTATLVVSFLAVAPMAAVAASDVVITQSNASIVMGDSSAGSNTVAVRVAAKPGDVVTITLDHRLWDSDTWLANFPYGTLEKNESANTVTFTFSNMTSAQLVSIPVTISPTVSHEQVTTALSDDARAALPASGDYSLDATLTRSGSTVATQSAAFTVAEKGYSTGSAWKNANDFKITGSYIQGRSYTFSAPTLLSVTAIDDSLDHPAWWSAKTRITLAVPGGFELDAASSPGWTQSSAGTISFDPTVSGAKPNFTGSFTDAPGDYSASEDSTISGYFGSSDELKTLTSTTKPTVTILDPATAAADPTLSIMKGGDDKAYIAPDSSPNRPGMINTYDVSYSATVPVESAEDYKDVTLKVQPADGSYLSGGTLTLSNPVAGDTVTVQLTSATGASQTVTYTVTAADETAKKATVTIPAAADTGWVDASATITSLKIGATMMVGFPKTQAQRVLSDGSSITDDTVKASSAAASGTAATSGSYGVASFTSDTTAAPKTVGEKVTYKKVPLINSDLALEIGVWRSPYRNYAQFIKSWTYGGNGSNLYPAHGGNTAEGATTTAEIYEPIVYEMLPRKAVYTGYTIKAGVTAPQVTSYQTSDGRTVVKFDWTGTGWWLNTRTDADYGKEFMDVNWKPAASGVATTSSAAIWVSNANDPDLTIKNYDNAIDQPISSDITDEATQGDTGATLVGTYTVTLKPTDGYAAFSSSISGTSNEGMTPTVIAGDPHIVNPLTSTTTADHTIQTTITNSSTEDVNDVNQLIVLPADLSLELTGAATVTDADGVPVTDGNEVQVLYSTESVGTPPSEASGLDGMQALTADQVPFAGGWSKVRAIIVKVPTSASQTEYQISLPVTDESASTQVKKWGAVTATTYADSDKYPTTTQTLYDSYAIMHGTKNWDDEDDVMGTRPSSLDIDLKSGSKTVETVTTNQWQAWEYDFTASPIDASGNFIDFTTQEATVPDDYEASADGLNITNKYAGFLSQLPFTGGTGSSFASLALVFAAVSFAAAVGSLIVQKRRITQ